MSRKYSSTWKTKSLTIDFAQKQWRQDFGEFIRTKLFWDGTTRITRAKIIDEGNNLEKIKKFEVYNAYGNSVTVKFKNQNEVLYADRQELLNEYLEKRGVKWNI